MLSHEIFSRGNVNNAKDRLNNTHLQLRTKFNLQKTSNYRKSSNYRTVLQLQQLLKFNMQSTKRLQC